MKCVLDTNIFISGIFWEGNFCSQIIDAWRKRRFILISSIFIIEELIEVLKDFKIRMSDEQIKEWQNLIIQNSIIVEPLTEINIVEEHSADNKFIEAAVEGKADYIISQDKHLLEVRKYKEIEILTPEEFLRVIS